MAAGGGRGARGGCGGDAVVDLGLWSLPRGDAAVSWASGPDGCGQGPEGAGPGGGAGGSRPGPGLPLRGRSGPLRVRAGPVRGGEAEPGRAEGPLGVLS